MRIGASIPKWPSSSDLWIIKIQPEGWKLASTFGCPWARDQDWISQFAHRYLKFWTTPFILSLGCLAWKDSARWLIYFFLKVWLVVVAHFFCYPKTDGWKTYLTTHIDTLRQKEVFVSFIFGELHGPLTSFDLFYPWIMENLGEDFLTLNVARAAKTTGTPLLILHGDRDRSVPLETLGGSRCYGADAVGRNMQIEVVCCVVCLWICLEIRWYQLIINSSFLSKSHAKLDLIVNDREYRDGIYGSRIRWVPYPLICHDMSWHFSGMRSCYTEPRRWHLPKSGIVTRHRLVSTWDLDPCLKRFQTWRQDGAL